MNDDATQPWVRNGEPQRRRDVVSGRIMHQGDAGPNRDRGARFAILRAHIRNLMHDRIKLPMATFEQVRQIVGDVLQLGDRTATLQPDTALLGNIPEFDSMAVVSVITALEDQLGILVEDDDITGETFETLGNLTAFVQSKL